jgi:hypothetical protein
MGIQNQSLDLVLPTLESKVFRVSAPWTSWLSTNWAPFASEKYRRSMVRHLDSGNWAVATLFNGVSVAKLQKRISTGRITVSIPTVSLAKGRLIHDSKKKKKKKKKKSFQNTETWPSQ